MAVFVDNFVKGFAIGQLMRESAAVANIARSLEALERGEDPEAVASTLREVLDGGKGLFDTIFGKSGAAPQDAELQVSSRGLPDGPEPAWLQYANQGAQRNLPLSPELLDAFSQFVPDMGLTVEVRSGGQGPGSRGRTGSSRHDYGNAADVAFYKDGRLIDWSRGGDDLALAQEIIRRARAAGVTGIGVGHGYMAPGMMHLGFGPEAVWGAEGKHRNAPRWAVDAFMNGGGDARTS